MAAAVATRYQLKLGSMWLSPASNIYVEESADFEQLAGADASANAGCSASSSSCSLTTERTFTFRIYIQGRGSLADAWRIYNRIIAQLDSVACSGGLVLLQRQVQDEPALIYAVQPKSTVRMIETRTQFICDHILTIELKLALKATNTLSNGLVIGGTPANPIYTVTPAPIPMSIAYPTPIISMSTIATPSPIAAVIGYPAPSISMGIAGSPLAITVSVRPFVRDLAGVDVTTPSTGFMYIPAKRACLIGNIDFDTDDLRLILVMTNTTADTETDKEFISQFTTLDEMNGAGYARVALTGEAVAQDAGNNRAEFDAADAAFAALTNGTRQITGCIVYKHVTNDSDSRPIFYMPYTNFNPGGSVLTNEWDVEGLAWLS